MKHTFDLEKFEQLNDELFAVLEKYPAYYISHASHIIFIKRKRPDHYNHRGRSCEASDAGSK